METLEWAAYEYEERERGTDWFWALGIIIVAGGIASIIFKNYFFAILLIMGGICLGYFATKKPDLVRYKLGDKGLQIQNQIYLYKNIKSFFVRAGDNPMLFIKSQRVFMPMINVPLDGLNPDRVREVMTSNNIKEEEMKEHFSEKVIDSLGI